MAKLLNNISLSTPTAKIVELADHYVINGQLYNKDSMTPIPLQFYPVQSSVTCELSLNQNAYVEGMFTKNRIINNIMVDSNDPSITYYCTQGIYSGGNCCLHKSITNSDGTMKDFFNAGLGSSYRETLEPYSQDSETVYCLAAGNYSYSYYSSIYYYNKNTMLCEKALYGENNQLNLLKDTEGSSYFYVSSYNAPTAWVTKFDKSTKKFSSIFTEANTGGFLADYMPSKIKPNGDFYVAKDGFSLGCSDHFMRYRKYNLDYAKGVVVSTPVNVDMSAYPKGEINISSKGISITHELIEYVDNGENFITHLIYNKSTTYNSLLPSESAMYTYKIVDDLNWTLVSYTEFNPIVYRAALPLFNGKIIAMAFEKGCHIYNWDSGNKKYTKTASYDMPTISVGCDSSNNIYIHFKDGTVEMISNVMPTTIYCDFKQDNYNYTGEEIHTSVVISTKNISGNYLNCNMQVQLFGNVKFTDNGSKTKIVSTSNTGSVEIPVTIVDTGILRTSAKMI